MSKRCYDITTEISYIVEVDVGNNEDGIAKAHAQGRLELIEKFRALRLKNFRVKPVQCGEGS